MDYNVNMKKIIASVYFIVIFLIYSCGVQTSPGIDIPAISMPVLPDPIPSFSGRPLPVPFRFPDPTQVIPPSPSPSPSRSPSASPSPSRSPFPTPPPTPAPKPSPSPSPDPSPIPSPDPSPSVYPSADPTDSPTPPDSPASTVSP